jgi:hypothetical protein
VSGGLGVGRQAVGDCDDEGVAAGSQPESQGAGGEQDAVAGLRSPDQRGIGEGAEHPAVVVGYI